MSIQEMHYDFNFKLDKVDSLQKENFNVAQRDWLINEAISVVLKRKYGVNNQYRQGFEVTQKRISDLQTLVIKSPTANQIGLVPTAIDTEVYTLDLNALTFDYMYLVRARADVTKDECTKKYADCKQVQHDDLNFIEKSPFHKPSFEWEEIPVVFAKVNIANTNGRGALYLMSDGTFTIDKVYLDYIKKPARVHFGGYESLNQDITQGPVYSTTDVVHCDLDRSIHNEIIDEAVAIASGIIEDPQFMQLKQLKISTNE